MHTLCKYGFPYALLKHGLVSLAFDIIMPDSKVRMPREFSKAWDGRINVQGATQLGLVRCLDKYGPKIEPTFTLSVKQDKTEVDNSAPLTPGSLWNVEYLLTTSMPYISASVHPMNFYYAPTESFIFTLSCY